LPPRSRPYLVIPAASRRQLTNDRNFAIRTVSLDHGRIVYQVGAYLHVYDIVAGPDRLLVIDLASDFDQERRHLLKHPLGFFEGGPRTTQRPTQLVRLRPPVHAL